MICSENTAINTGIARSIKENIKYFKEDTTVLDYGAGKLRNSFYLTSLGCKVTAADTEIQINRLFNKLSNEEMYKINNLVSLNELDETTYDIVLSTFVICVIPQLEERMKMLHNIYKHIGKNGIAILETRTEKSILQAKYIKPHLDGYIIGSGIVKTFQVGYSIPELEKLLNEAKLNVIKANNYGNSISFVLNRME